MSGTLSPKRAETVAPAVRSSAVTSAFSVEFVGVGRAFEVPQRRRRVPQVNHVLRDVSLRVEAGEILAILGPSGCGKSTLLRIAGGLDTPTSGSALIDGTSVRDIDQRCAVGFQEPRLLPWRTVAENVAFGLPRRAAPDDRVAELLELVGLSAAARLRPAEISGGMAQRVSLARALARNPGVLLLDEPFGALDALTRLQMQDMLVTLHAATATTIILVTHDVDEALQLADRVIVLGQEPHREGSTIRTIQTVSGMRPREAGSSYLGALRRELLAQLGVGSSVTQN